MCYTFSIGDTLKKGNGERRLVWNHSTCSSMKSYSGVPKE